MYSKKNTCTSLLRQEQQKAFLLLLHNFKFWLFPFDRLYIINMKHADHFTLRAIFMMR